MVITDGDWTLIRAAACVEAARFNVVPEIHPDDLLFRFLWDAHRGGLAAVRYYFEDGANSAEKFQQIVGQHVPSNARILEFAAGYGRVTRHLAKSTFALTASDIHSAANCFNAQTLGVKTLPSSDVPEEFRSDEFAGIFALSFFSHMPRQTWLRWLQTLHSRLTEGGILVFTTHGPKSFRKARPDNTGYWFRPGSEQSDLAGSTYGSTVTTRPFVDDAISKLRDVEFVDYEPAGWWGHQDVYTIKRRAGASHRPDLPAWFGRRDYLLPLSIATHQAKRFFSHIRQGRF